MAGKSLRSSATLRVASMASSCAATASAGAIGLLRRAAHQVEPTMRRCSSRGGRGKDDSMRNASGNAPLSRCSTVNVLLCPIREETFFCGEALRKPMDESRIRLRSFARRTAGTPYSRRLHAGQSTMQRSSCPTVLHADGVIFAKITGRGHLAHIRIPASYTFVGAVISDR